MAEEEAWYQAAYEARDAAWKNEVVELWGRARRRAEEVYEDGYFVRKVIGVGRLVAAWRWADKLQRATDEELRWAPNEMARSSARPPARGRAIRQALRGGGGGVLPPHREDAAHQGAPGVGLPEYWPQEGLLVLVLFVFNFMHCT